MERNGMLHTWVTWLPRMKFKVKAETCFQIDNLLKMVIIFRQCIDPDEVHTLGSVNFANVPFLLRKYKNQNLI